MKFYSKYRAPLYIITPTVAVNDGPLGRPRTVVGLEAQFTPDPGAGASEGGTGPRQGSTFDTELAQAANGWKDEERELVEETLKKNADFSITLFLRDVTSLAEAAPVKVCSHVVLVSGSPMTCGRPIQGDGDLCPEHLEQLAVASVGAGLPDVPAPEGAGI